LLLAEVMSLVGLTEDGAAMLDAPRTSVESEMVVVERLVGLAGNECVGEWVNAWKAECRSLDSLRSLGMTTGALRSLGMTTGALRSLGMTTGALRSLKMASAFVQGAVP